MLPNSSSSRNTLYTAILQTLHLLEWQAECALQLPITWVLCYVPKQRLLDSWAISFLGVMGKEGDGLPCWKQHLCPRAVGCKLILLQLRGTNTQTSPAVRSSQLACISWSRDCSRASTCTQGREANKPWHNPFIFSYSSLCGDNISPWAEQHVWTNTPPRLHSLSYSTKNMWNTDLAVAASPDR